MLREDNVEQVGTKLMELREVQSLLVRSDRELAAQYEQRTKTTSEFAQLQMQSVNETVKMTDSECIAIESKQLTKRAKAGNESGNGMSTLSTAACFALLAERNDCISR